MTPAPKKERKVRIGRDGTIFVDDPDRAARKQAPSSPSPASQPPVPSPNPASQTTAPNGSNRLLFALIALLAILAIQPRACGEIDKNNKGATYTSVSSQTQTSAPATSGDPSSSSSSSQGSLEPDSEGWITASGTIKREVHHTSQTGLAWARVVYFLQFDEQTTIRYKNAYGDSKQASMTKIAIAHTEKYGPDADEVIDSQSIPEWEQRIGQRVTVHGRTFDNGNAHTVGDVMLVDSEVV